MRSYPFQVHLGSGIWVDEEKWHQLQVTQGDSKYTKNLAVMIWGTDVLKNRSVTGVATKKKKDAVPKPPLSPHKLSIVRGESCTGDAVTEILPSTLAGMHGARFSSTHLLKPPRARPWPGHRNTGADTDLVLGKLTLTRQMSCRHTCGSRSSHARGTEGGSQEGRRPLAGKSGRVPAKWVTEAGLDGSTRPGDADI